MQKNLEKAEEIYEDLIDKIGELTVEVKVYGSGECLEYLQNFLVTYEHEFFHTEEELKEYIDEKFDFVIMKIFNETYEMLEK